MSFRKKEGNFKFYLAELLILVIGITLSFWLNEWRLGKAERNLEIATLNHFRENLKSDSSVISQNIALLEGYVKNDIDLLHLEKNLIYHDSLNSKLVLMMSYFNFTTADIAYQEMQGLGNSRIIRNKDLLNNIVGLYTNVYSGLYEYLGADKNFNTSLMMPFITKNLPFALNFDYSTFDALGKRGLMRVITSDEMKHLIQLDLVFKASSKEQFEISLDRVVNLMREIDLVLANE